MIPRVAAWGRLAAVLAAGLVVVTAFAASAQQQTEFPNKPVRIIVPYAAGGIADTTMRIVAQKLSDKFNQQFVIENRPGAGGIVAAKAGAAAAPDGYTLSMTGNHNAISRSLFKTVPYDILAEFTSISTTAYFDLLIVTRSDGPLRSLQDVIEYARGNPARLNIGTINPGSTQNLGAELFRIATGIKATIVPFRASPEMAAAVLRGDVDIIFEFFSALGGPIADKKMTALASTGAKRTAYLPNVPTVRESGTPDYEVSSWNGISGPAGLPADIVGVLNRAIVEVLTGPDIREKSMQFGMELRGSTPEEMTARMTQDIAKWAAVIEKAGIPKQ